MAVAEAHSHKLLHRDIKPQNIIVGRKGVEDDFATLLDFGLVKSLDVVKDDTLTGPLTWAGTPKYSPPERIAQPRNADTRTDVYGLGIVLYRMLTGRDPFAGDCTDELFAKILTQPPPDVQQFAVEPVSRSTLELLQQCLAKDPNQRPASALVLLELIRACESNAQP